ncbi:MAG: hypothetical protein COV46_04495 [Deltaproteobacteria bacterium CG11_big_fil_rev_8_21_14_0_20_49_13]|nr:MAG: hypothetical protein COV46_04495 [Deltaproteobacteria bacterium CG11_big_fil_rev_8_21_14_0_20_49_13]
MSTPTNDLAEALWNDKPTQNGYQSEEQYHEHILEQYKLCIEMADRISSRRDVANGFFLTLNSLILGAVGFLFEKQNFLPSSWALLLPLAVLLLECFFWWRLIISYKQLNGAKFQIIGELESRLPASPYGKAEWDLLLKKGSERKTYWPLTHLESKIPVIFGIGYLVVTIVFLLK